MDVLKILNALDLAMKGANTAIQIGKDAKPFIVAIQKAFGKEEITDEDIDALIAEVEKQSAEIQAPLPPKEEGEEEG